MPSLKQEITSFKNPEKAKQLSRYFKTGKGEYGEGDIFIGATLWRLRSTAKKFRGTARKELKSLLKSKVHEERMTAALILVEKFRKASEEEKEKIFNFYFENVAGINNWDLVDLTAPTIVGGFLLNSDRSRLYKLAESGNVWERRIAAIATFAFIKKDEFNDSLAIAETLLQDKHDLIHKAVGWVLREIGKKDLKAEESFLKKHYREMPRTMLRYAIEKFPEQKRQAYLKRRANHCPG